MIDAPVQTDTTVSSVRRADGGYRVPTEPRGMAVRNGRRGHGSLQRAPPCPAFSDAVPSPVTTHDALRVQEPGRSWPKAACWSWAHRRPECRSHAEIQRSGRQVTLAVGEHVRGPVTTGDGISIGGWSVRRPRRALRRGRRHRARTACPVHAAGGLTTNGRSFDLNALTNAGVKLVVDWLESADVRLSSPGPCGTSASSRTSSLAGSWTPSTSGPLRTASTIGAAASPVPTDCCRRLTAARS